jgi:hypothetical protein
MRFRAFALATMAACSGGSGGTDGTPVDSLGADDRPRFWGAGVSPDGRFVAVGDEIAFSDDGVSWTAADVTLDGSLRSIAFGPDRWVAVGGVDQVVSDDGGETWTRIEIEPNPIVEASHFTSVGYRDGEFRATGTYADCQVFGSADGVSWTSLRYITVAEPRLVDDPVLGWLVYDRQSDITIAIDDAELPFTYVRGNVDTLEVVGHTDGTTWGFARKGFETVGVVLENEDWVVQERDGEDPWLRAMTDVPDVVIATDGIHRGVVDGADLPADLRFEHVEGSTSWMALAHRNDAWVIVGDGIAFSDDAGATWSKVLD